MHWLDLLDERQRKAVAFAEHYALTFNHGATGHNDLLLIHRLAGLLEYVTTHAGELPTPTPREDLPLGFGKYGSQTLRELVQHDRGYVEWLARDGQDADVKAAAQRVLGWQESHPARAKERAEQAKQADEKELPF